MTDRERFEVILEELGALLSPLGWSCDVVLIGAQALAAEQVAAGEDSLLQVETDTGQRLVRGYSLDPDLLLDPADPGESPRWDEIPEVLRFQAPGLARAGHADDRVAAGRPGARAGNRPALSHRSPRRQAEDADAKVWG